MPPFVSSLLCERLGVVSLRAVCRLEFLKWTMVYFFFRNKYQEVSVQSVSLYAGD
jgi:hypothetical protein